MLVDYVQRELADGSRTVVETEHWLAVVPYWAAWPFETLLLPKAHVLRITDLTNEQRADLALALKKLTSRYDNLFQCSFPYSMGWHGAPFNGEENQHWQLHAHFYPPLLRSATVLFFSKAYATNATITPTNHDTRDNGSRNGINLPPSERITATNVTENAVRLNPLS